MAEYAFVVCASDNYKEGVKALLASIHKHQPDADIILGLYKWDLEIPEEIAAKVLKEDLSDSNECQVRGTAIERFRIATEYIDLYESICLLDADMFLLYDCTIWFELAAKGFIVTGHNGMLINFNEAYHKQYDVEYNGDIIYEKLHTSVPIFISKKDKDWFDKLYNSRRFDYWDDFLYLNLLGKLMGKDKHMVCLPPYYFTGIHHFQMKPECGVFEKIPGIVLSGTEEIVYMVHGKWWWTGWTQDLWPTLEKFAKDEQIGPRGVQKMDQSIKLLKSLFNKYNVMFDGDKIVLKPEDWIDPEPEQLSNVTADRVSVLEEKMDLILEKLGGLK